MASLLPWLAASALALLAAPAVSALETDLHPCEVHDRPPANCCDGTVDTDCHWAMGDCLLYTHVVVQFCQAPADEWAVWETCQYWLWVCDPLPGLAVATP